MDRTTNGLLAGIIAGIAMNAWNLFDYYILHFTEIRFSDWFTALTTWDKPVNSIQVAIHLIFTIILWDGFLGIVFAHLINLINPKGLVYKAVFYSMLLWFFFKIIVNFYHVPVVSGAQPFPKAISNVLAIIIWGVILGLLLKKFENSANSEEN